MRDVGQRGRGEGRVQSVKGCEEDGKLMMMAFAWVCVGL